MINLFGSWIIGVINFLGYPGVFLLMLIESACIPIPSEVTMPFAGSLIHQGTFNFWILGIIGGLGNLAGSLLAYFIGWWGQETFIRDLIKKRGKYLLISVHEFDRSQKWFQKYGEIIVFGSRLLPAVRTFISLPAGIAKMNLAKFIFYTLLGSTIWSLILTYIGLVMGNNWKSLEVYFKKFDLLIVGSCLVIFIWFIYHRIKKLKAS